MTPVQLPLRMSLSSCSPLCLLITYVYNVWMFHRTSTPRGRRSSVGSASGFSFRLEERAEKRKEVTLCLQPFYLELSRADYSLL